MSTLSVNLSNMLKKMLLQVYKVKEEGSFARHVSVASSWNIFIVLAQFVLSPVITRLYSPSEYGIFALFNSIILNITLIGSLKYAESIVIADSKDQRNNSVALSFLLVCSTSFLTLLGIYFFKTSILKFLAASWLDGYLFIIPLSVFLAGILDILLTINIRRKKFFSNGWSGFLINVLSRGFAIFYGILMPAKAIGLMGGDLVGKIAGLAGVLVSFRGLKTQIQRFWRSISLLGMRMAAKTYSMFPVYVLPNAALTGLSGHLPIYFLQAEYNSTIVGAYAMASSLLEIVNRLVPYSVSSVFLPKAIELKKNSAKELSDGVFKIYWIMLAGAAAIFSGFALLGRIIFPFVFGSSWVTAGFFVAILSIYYAFNFISISLIEVYKVLNRQRFSLITTILSVILKVFALVYIVAFQMEIKNALLLFVLAGSIGSIIQILGIFIILEAKIWKVGLSLSFLMILLVFLVRLFNF